MQNAARSKSDSTLAVKPFDTALGAEISGLDLREAVSDVQFAIVLDAFLQHHVLVFRSQPINDEQHLAFAARFGELEGHINKSTHHEKHADVQVFSNVNADGTTTGANPDLGTLVWHTDKSYITRPSLATVLRSPAIASQGGDTLFCNTHAAYDELSDALRQEIENRMAIHSWKVSREKSGARPATAEELAAAPPVEHPIVRTHPVTRRKSIYLGNHAHQIVGIDEQESLQLLAELEAHMTQDKYVYRHQWQVDDVLMWDNRSTMHCVTPYDPVKEKRAVHRIVVKGDEPF